jgi:hypothetical protein
MHTKGNGELKHDRRYMRTGICFSFSTLHTTFSFVFYLFHYISEKWGKCNKMDSGKKIKQKSSLEEGRLYYSRGNVIKGIDNKTVRR